MSHSLKISIATLATLLAISFASMASAQPGPASMAAKSPQASGGIELAKVKRKTVKRVSKRKAKKKAACKSEPGCPCVNGKQVCH